MELLGRRHRLTPAVEPTLKDILVLRPGADPDARLGPLAPPARRVTHPGRGAGRVPWAGEEPEETGTPARMFSWGDVTSGLPDVCREEDEGQQGRRLRVLLGRVKAARAVVATTHGLAETLASDSQKAASFYARFGITEDLFLRGARL